MSLEDNTSMISHDEICEDAFKHYEELATKCHNWSSTVVHAIKFYKQYGKGKVVVLADLKEEEIRDCVKGKMLEFWDISTAILNYLKEKANGLFK